MKVFIVLSLCLVLAWAECENLAERQECDSSEGDCSCQAGLSCVLTKKMILDGTTKLVKQCMPEGAQVDVEIIDLDDQELISSVSRAKRFLFPKRCQTEADCEQGKCCAGVIKRCMPKIKENGSCNFYSLHKCGCMDGLECQATTDVNILGIKFPLKQCVRV